jgi:hypothetical protein
MPKTRYATKDANRGVFSDILYQKRKVEMTGDRNRIFLETNSSEVYLGYSTWVNRS